ncbi:hypothetical protein NDU88_001578 [Pleurodeles waltl]|uniref:Uncharacterized protein n=1 Tax=Pleurodeles waltl TaxID=8319 RepID=A0AAV7L9Z0_PLEWA|nr:hypothetical protein NDU88_001578 [Pleurodeles waltl]
MRAVSCACRVHAHQAAASHLREAARDVLFVHVERFAREKQLEACCSFGITGLQRRYRQEPASYITTLLSALKNRYDRSKNCFRVPGGEKGKQTETVQEEDGDWTRHGEEDAEPKTLKAERRGQEDMGPEMLEGERRGKEDMDLRSGKQGEATKKPQDPRWL